MITERALYGKVEVEAFIDGTWTPLLADATGLTVRRGGTRDGFGIKTDVGLCTFRLLNAQDPMDGGTLAPGMPVRVVTGEYVPSYEIEHEAEVVYSEDFEAGDDGGWSTFFGFSTDAVALSGEYSFRLNNTDSGDPTDGKAVYTVTDLAPGVDYTLRAWVKGGGAAYGASLGVTGKSNVNIAPGDTAWHELTYNFTATATSHELYFTTGGTAGGPGSYWDDITLTQDAYTEVIPEVDRTPIFTGRIAHLNSRYPINKQTGESRAYTEVTVADAVQIHSSTMRYGVDLGADTDETFEERIERLEASAQAPVEVPEVGAPLEVYSF